MVNLKIIAGGAVTGLIISLISGLIGGVSFGAIIIRALISALVCGVLGAGVDYVFKHYLGVDSNSNANVYGGSAESSAPSSRSVGTGSTVNISIGDDPLPDTDGAPGFIVTNFSDAPAAQSQASVHRSEPEKTEIPPVEKAAPATPAAVREPASGFVPVSLGSITSSSPENTRAQASSSGSAPAGNASSEMFDGLDAMPELEEIVSSVDDPKIVSSGFGGASGEDNGSAGNGIDDMNQGAIVDGNFSEMGGSQATSSVTEVDVGTDASLMAQAIRTLLKSDG